MEYTKKPLSIEEVRERKDEDNLIAGTVLIDKEVLTSYNYEAFIDTISRKLIEVDYIPTDDVDYEVLGDPDKEDTIFVKVKVDVTSILRRADRYTFDNPKKEKFIKLLQSEYSPDDELSVEERKELSFLMDLARKDLYNNQN